MLVASIAVPGCKERLSLSSRLSIIIATIMNIYNNLGRDAHTLLDDAQHHDVSQLDQTVHSGGKKGKITRQHFSNFTT